MGYDRTLTPESLIHTEGLKTATILAALYNAACKIGFGEKNPGPDTITLSEASAILKAQPKTPRGKLRYFDYLNGKRLKIDLSEAYTSGIVAGQYDFYYGHGTAKMAIEILKATGDPCHPNIIALQATSRAVAIARTGLRSESGTITEGNLADAFELTEPVSLTEEDWENIRQDSLTFYGPNGLWPDPAKYQVALDGKEKERSRRYNYERHRKIPCTTINF